MSKNLIPKKLRLAVRKAVGKQLNQQLLLSRLRAATNVVADTDLVNPNECQLTEPVSSKDKLVITWIIPPFAAKSGGHVTIFRMVRHLSRTHTCRLLIFDWLDRTNIDQARQLLQESFFDTGASLEMLSDHTINRPTDVVIATSWHTAYAATRFKNTRSKLYFIQDLENLFTPAGTEQLLTEESYRFGFPAITAGSWLKKRVSEDYGTTAEAFPLAFDPQEYSQLSHQRLNQIAVYARPATERRAFELTVLALRAVQLKHPQTKIVLYGTDDLYPIPDLTYENRGILDHTELNQLYNQSQVGLVISATNYSLIPLEMMAAGLPVVDITGDNNHTIYGAKPDFIRLARPNPAALAEALCNILEDPKLAARQQQKALEYVQKFSWEQSANQVEQYIKRFLNHA